MMSVTCCKKNEQWKQIWIPVMCMVFYLIFYKQCWYVGNRNILEAVHIVNLLHFMSTSKQSTKSFVSFVFFCIFQFVPPFSFVIKPFNCNQLALIPQHFLNFSLNLFVFTKIKQIKSSSEKHSNLLHTKIVAMRYDLVCDSASYFYSTIYTSCMTATLSGLNRNISANNESHGWLSLWKVTVAVS